MKFWKKIFLYSIILTTTLINIIGIIIIEKIHKNNLDRAIKSTIDNQRNIISYLHLDSSKLGSGLLGAHKENAWFEITLRDYIYSNIVDIKNIEIFDEDDKLITLLNESHNEKDSNYIISKINSQERLFQIKTINNEKNLLVASKFEVEDRVFKLVLWRSLEFLYKDRVENYRLFLLLDIFINILLVTGMYIISKRITKPIVDLAELSIEIAKGEYNKRAKYSKNNDEIAILSENFNVMMEELEGKIEELEIINNDKESFINNLTHEIKTPITSIMGYSDLLLNGNINEEIKLKALKYINSEGRRLESLSSALIKLITIKNSNREDSTISIKECISNSVQSLSYKLVSKKISLNIDIIDGEIVADRQLIIVLLINILENSIKACHKNGIIDITGKIISNNLYSLSIKDDGVGIPKEDLNKIMEPFYMVDKSRDRGKNGLGLGLAICKEICKIYKIQFDINSSLNKGTIITLTMSNRKGIK